MVLLGLLSVRLASGADLWKGAAAFTPAAAEFVVADLDGDEHPDTASIRTGATDGARTSYSIRLRLSAARCQSIELLGPAGGLEIAARDVNGDHAIDLVVTTAWVRLPVAILLNDGHGHFSQADPTDFSGAFDNASTVLGRREAAGTRAVANAPQQDSQPRALVSEFVELPPEADGAGLRDIRLVSSAGIACFLSRGPPAIHPLFQEHSFSQA